MLNPVLVFCSDLHVLLKLKCVLSTNSIVYTFRVSECFSIMLSCLRAGIAGLFTVFSSFIFTSSIINFMGSEVSDLK